MLAEIENILLQIDRFLVFPDEEWSLCSFPFLVAFIIFYAIYIGVSHTGRKATLTYVTAFSLFFAWKANGLLMFLLPATALFSWWALASSAIAAGFDYHCRSVAVGLP